MSAVEGAKVLTSLLEKSVAEGTKSEISIEADSGSNALLVIAPAHEFKWLKELVEKIDKAPQQVMVEVLIIEVNEGKRLDMGVEWSAVDSAAEGRTTVMGRARMAETDILQNAIQKGIYPQGLAVGIATGLATDGTPLIPFLLHALGTDSDIKILSKVPIWAQDNKEASVSVVENIPILTSTIEGGAGTSRDVIQNIDRMDVGIKLELTPHVNPNKEITLKLHPSIEAIINEGPADKPFTPTIAKREVSTTVTVPDGNTIIISGLVREDKIKTIRKIPLLGDIPILGALFRYKSENARRTNLLIFVTPHLVTDMQNALQQKKKWEQATGLSESVAEEELQPGKEE
jgi:general secretion pathway protein D